MGCRQGITRRVVATALSVRGDVTYGFAGRDGFRKLELDARPAVGSVVRTSEGGALDLNLFPGALLRVSENSEFEIEELKITKDGNETGGGMIDRVAQIRLTRGKILVYFQQADYAKGRILVTTDRVIVSGEPGSLFEVESDASKTRLTSARGSIDGVQANGADATIRTGYFREWPSISGTTAAAGDSRAEADVAAALKTAQELDNLESEHPRYIPW